jgi:enterochelin esterase-like enzyme
MHIHNMRPEFAVYVEGLHEICFFVSMIRQAFIFLNLLLCAFTALAQPPLVSSGTIKRYENFSSKYVDARNIDVWLPENYSPKKKYAILYMHDGQMLFDSTANWNHQEWRVDETLGRLMKEKKIRDCIVVGIWNTGLTRSAEYFPQKAITNLSDDKQTELLPLLNSHPLADNYLRFLVGELKPFIDSVFSTHRDQQNTFVCGSSFGGLISMYAICEYPEVFGGAACLSTHWTGLYRADNNPVPDAVLEYFNAHLPSPKDHRFYFDHGTATLDSLYAPFQLRADSIMKAHGFTGRNLESRVFNGEDHSERAWARRFEIPALFLLKK